MREHTDDVRVCPSLSLPILGDSAERWLLLVFTAVRERLSIQLRHVPRHLSVSKTQNFETRSETWASTSTEAGTLKRCRYPAHGLTVHAHFHTQICTHAHVHSDTHGPHTLFLLRAREARAHTRSLTEAGQPTSASGSADAAASPFRRSC